eukprot:CAMPEP_0114618592 /NCGR_PEP_ID=MMETSP0168-20121206/7778_1 /TAXON_ID=95228 ORGANISM="Vannella sp., Strain DIVA3 517/6/12" /NCGR_SAMPLE_ID=MMETSP0168 /ASSEMBLY_ACC=CAM_ASM_000044 /LENGTH=325 /DNA_ID=CAMNT_0001829735 /DNA_START=104 /DNA_END=1081 /DNA_ORIENTATION=+
MADRAPTTPGDGAYLSHSLHSSGDSPGATDGAAEVEAQGSVLCATTEVPQGLASPMAFPSGEELAILQEWVDEEVAALNQLREPSTDELNATPSNIQLEYLDAPLTNDWEEILRGSSTIPCTVPPAAEVAQGQAAVAMRRIQEEPAVGQKRRLPCGNGGKALKKTRPDGRACCQAAMQVWQHAVNTYGLLCHVQGVRHSGMGGDLRRLKFAYLYKNTYFELPAVPGCYLCVKLNSNAGTSFRHGRLGFGHECAGSGDTSLVVREADGKWKFSLFLMERNKCKPMPDDHSITLTCKMSGMHEALWSVTLHFHVPSTASQVPAQYFA